MRTIAQMLGLKQQDLEQCERTLDLLSTVMSVGVGNDARKVYVVGYSMYAAGLQLLYQYNPGAALQLHDSAMEVWHEHKDDPIEEETADQR